MLDKIFGNNNSEPEQLSSSVRIVGDRSSGKTTYMAALARWPNANPSNSAVQTVTPINKDGEDLIKIAKNLLEQGDTLEPTPLGVSVNEVKDYSIKIVLKPDFSWRRTVKGVSTVSLEINCKDYPGEFFSDLLLKTKDPLLKDYIRDCNKADGILLLLDGMVEKKDSTYANGIEELFKHLDRSGHPNNQKRLAIVLNKCEDPDLWVNRRDPNRIALSRFPKLLGTIKNWQNLKTGEVDYFAVSAFGRYGERFPQPNMRKIETKIINDEEVDLYGLEQPDSWKPFGLVAPIYWLCTGQRHSKLDQE